MNNHEALPKEWDMLFSRECLYASSFSFILLTSFSLWFVQNEDCMRQMNQSSLIIYCLNQVNFAKFIFTMIYHCMAFTRVAPYRHHEVEKC